MANAFRRRPPLEKQPLLDRFSRGKGAHPSDASAQDTPHAPTPTCRRRNLVVDMVDPEFQPVDDWPTRPRFTVPTEVVPGAQPRVHLGIVRAAGAMRARQRHATPTACRQLRRVVRRVTRRAHLLATPRSGRLGGGSQGSPESRTPQHSSSRWTEKASRRRRAMAFASTAGGAVLWRRMRYALGSTGLICIGGVRRLGTQAIEALEGTCKLDCACTYIACGLRNSSPTLVSMGLWEAQ